LERPEKKDEATGLTSNYSESDYIVEDKNKDYKKYLRILNISGEEWRSNITQNDLD
jgi:hypothetical protein